MREIDIASLVSKLIDDYEKVNGRMQFEVQKMDNSFTYTNVDQKLLDILNLNQNDIIGKSLIDFPINQDNTEKLTAIFNKALNGQKVVFFLTPNTNENVCLVVTVRPVKKEGNKDRLIGSCVPIDIKHIEGTRLPIYYF
ncbi:hypothetical protein ACIQAA_14095 [Neobacillus sp. NPDC093182]|uniref:hypothetical protein n=1 Tax=Neobacillus sp. NPDC093182 TaxID=3364297 RepID=UPI0037F78438